MNEKLKPCPLPRCGKPARYHERLNMVSCSYCSTFHQAMPIEDWQSISRVSSSRTVRKVAQSLRDEAQCYRRSLDTKGTLDVDPDLLIEWIERMAEHLDNS